MRHYFRAALSFPFLAAGLLGCGGEGPIDHENLGQDEQAADSSPGFCNQLYLAGYYAYQHHRIDLMAVAFDKYLNCHRSCEAHPVYPEVRSIMVTLGYKHPQPAWDFDYCRDHHTCLDATQEQWDAFLADIYSKLDPPPPAPEPEPPPPEPPPSGYSCPDGWRCDGSPVTGGPDETVCGTDLGVWVCTSSGWQPTGSPCSC